MGMVEPVLEKMLRVEVSVLMEQWLLPSDVKVFQYCDNWSHCTVHIRQISAKF